MYQYSGQVMGVARDFMYKVYGWMAAALMISAGVAYYTFATPAVYQAVFNSGLIWALFIGQLALVIFLTAMINKMNTATAVMSYVLYAALSGLTLSSIFMMYTLSSIAATFVVAAGMFAFMAVWGYLTQEDLSSMSSFLMMGLVGLVIAGLVNIFLRSPGFSYVISAIGVIVFALLTAYDVQKIKQLGAHMLAQGDVVTKVAILGALTLYLDFINLFLYLLRFMGRRRD